MSIDKKIVSLNRAASSAGSPERPARTTTSEKAVPIQILIVDDEPRNLIVLETVLDDPGYRLVRAHSADEALLALVAQEFALLILDIQMPGMTGFELADVIKNRKKTSQIPIIFLTAYYSEDQHVLEGYGTGAVDYLHKPVNPQILRSKVAVFAELHRKSRDVAIINAALLNEVKERRSAEEQLRQLNETLEQRVNERTEELQQANRMKDEFLAMLRTQLAHLNLLDRITRAIADHQDFGSISHVVLRNLEDHLPVHFGCICLYDRARQALTVSRVGAKSRVLAAQLAMTEQSVIDIDGNGLARCVEGELIYEPDVSRVDFKFPQRLARVGLRAFVAAPILVEGQVFGVMIMARRDAGNFESPDCEFLRQLSLHVGLAAHQAHLYTALQHAYDDLRQTHKTILQQERLRVVGQMASGIAHDINNALSPAALYAQSLLEGTEPLSERSRESLKIIGRAIDNVSKTVTRLREFYRPHELAVAPITVNCILGEVLKLTQARWQDMPQERGIVIRPQLERNSELPTIIASESELRDALTNLVLNAIDAMPNGGTLTLRSARDTASASPGAVIIEVCDTGIGMDELTRSRCLEPFFTTKGERGTGLGFRWCTVWCSAMVVTSSSRARRIRVRGYD